MWNCKGSPIKVWNGTQQDLNKIVDFGQIWGQKDRLLGPY